MNELPLLGVNLLPWGRTEGRTEGPEVQQSLIVHVRMYHTGSTLQGNGS